MKTLTIIYRVCDIVEISSVAKRDFGTNKRAVIERCYNMLIKNIAYINKNTNDFKVELIIVEDHCTYDMIDYLIKRANEYKIIPGVCRMSDEDKQGNALSFFTCCEIAKNSENTDILYFIEDDYLLYNKENLLCMLKDMEYMSEEDNIHVAIFPDDYPDRYENNKANGVDIRVTPNGHYMRIYSTTCTFMLYKEDFIKNYSWFEKFKYWPAVGENDSINHAWENIPIYSPLPGKSLHCQTINQVPVYENYEFINQGFK